MSEVRKLVEKWREEATWLGHNGVANMVKAAILRRADELEAALAAQSSPRPGVRAGRLAMRELKPCPFCGNDVNDDEGCFQSGGFIGPKTPVWSVRCGNPSCNADVSAASADAAIAAWNTRAQPAGVAVSDAMVWAGVCAWRDVYDAEYRENGSTMGNDDAAMKAALTAALGDRNER